MGWRIIKYGLAVAGSVACLWMVSPEITAWNIDGWTGTGVGKQLSNRHFSTNDGGQTWIRTGVQVQVKDNSIKSVVYVTTGITCTPPLNEEDNAGKTLDITAQEAQKVTDGAQSTICKAPATS